MTFDKLKDYVTEVDLEENYFTKVQVLDMMVTKDDLKETLEKYLTLEEA
jgi:hypothetical protein